MRGVGGKEETDKHEERKRVSGRGTERQVGKTEMERLIDG